MDVVRTLHLEEDKVYGTTLYRIEKGSIIRFALGSSLLAQDVNLFCNHPIVDSETLDEKIFHHLPWTTKTEYSLDLVNNYSDVKIRKAGVFKFYLEKNTCSSKFKICQGSFIVDPVLSFKNNKLHLDSVILQTVLSKCLGPFSQWKPRLQVAYESSYNMIHFTPIQERGSSNSAYSLKDHLKLDPSFSDGNITLTEEVLKSFIENICEEWGMFSIIDVVWNHCASNSEWILEHPNAGYNLKNSPHLRPAFLVDRTLFYLSKDISDGKLSSRGLTKSPAKEEDLDLIKVVLRERLESLKLHEFYQVDVKNLVQNFFDGSMTKKDGIPQIIQDPEYKRFGCDIDLAHVASLCYNKCKGLPTEKARKEAAMENFQKMLEDLNKEKEIYVSTLIENIIHNTAGHVRYHFLDDSGPKQHLDNQSLTTRYLSYPFTHSSIEQDELLMDKNEAALVMAHNGWVMGGDALKNFAESDSSVYLCRELVAWGDSIKLRYGSKPEDSPYLWNLMKDYTQRMARVFHGFRLDNCHGTPIHVAEYLVSCARKINPDLLVMAELFTSSEHTDNTFVNRLGLNTLIRENMGASSPRDLGRHVHRFSGDAVGSFFKTSTQPLRPAMAHAIFMDVTHDNPSLFESRCPFDVLPSAAMVLATTSGSGSSRGFDELVPHHIHVVKEDRYYRSWSNDISPSSGYITSKHGILYAKKALNKLHMELGNKGFTEIFVDQVTEEIAFITRHCPHSHESFIIVAHSAFSTPAKENYPCKDNRTCNVHVPPLKINGVLDKVVFEAQLFEENHNIFVRHTDFINGAMNYELQMQENINIDQSKLAVLRGANGHQEVHFKNFFPGSVIVFKVQPTSKVKTAIQTLRHVLSLFSHPNYRVTNKTTDVDIKPVDDIISKLSLADLNRVLYRCNNEERDDGNGSGPYNIPRYGEAVYCGIQGFMSVMSAVRFNNDLGHPICDNLRAGDWMPGYIANRLMYYQSTKPLGLWLESVFTYLRDLPRYLIPCYFEAILTSVHVSCMKQAFNQMSKFIQNGDSLVKSLSLGCVQMCGVTNSSKLPAVSQNIDVEEKRHSTDHYLTMAAGLPHFSTGFMRCWGRDTFIALRGLLLITGRYHVARNLILSFGGCVRHGLIPNLLAEGKNARYNARDATWFWLQAIQDYSNMKKDGHSILNAPVVRMYPTDDSEPQVGTAKEVPLQDVIQEILERHFQGILFRERNAGESLDRDMSFDGFVQSAGVDLETGFIYGGSKENCGTWMDKMGSSNLAANKGHPATPRDGSAVELVGLCKSALRWLIEMHDQGYYKYHTVTRTNHSGGARTWTYKEWEEKIQQNFEPKFYVGDKDSADIDKNLIHKRNIYKDSYQSTNGFTDYQLRPNFPIAMCVAPELFETNHACEALQKIEKHLLGPMGLATLDPDDWNYDGFYENDLDSKQFNKALGFNYHQGPEWTWVLGPFLRAKLIFAKKSGKDIRETTKEIYRALSRHKEELSSSSWKGLPELTNKNGAYCHHSCPTQAWSMSCLLEVLYDLKQCGGDVE